MNESKSPPLYNFLQKRYCHQRQLHRPVQRYCQLLFVCLIYVLLLCQLSWAFCLKCLMHSTRVESVNTVVIAFLRASSSSVPITSRLKSQPIPVNFIRKWAKKKELSLKITNVVNENWSYEQRGFPCV